MNFQEFFRSFVGLNQKFSEDRREGGYEDRGNKFRNPPWGDDADEDDEFDELYSDYRGGRFGFNMFSGDLMDIHKYFENEMNQMMKTFSSLGVGSFGFSNGIEGGLTRAEEDERDIRDRYLKSPTERQETLPKGELERSIIDHPRFFRTKDKTDSDLDDRVSSGGVGALFKKEPAVDTRPPPTSFSRSFTSRVIIDNNGRVEERTREWWSDGRETERISRTIGSEKHSITKMKDKEGAVQEEEHFVNMQQDSLPDFDKKWRRSCDDDKTNNGASPVQSDNRDGALGIFSPLFRLFS